MFLNYRSIEQTVKNIHADTIYQIFLEFTQMITITGNSTAFTQVMRNVGLFVDFIPLCVQESNLHIYMCACKVYPRNFNLQFQYLAKAISAENSRSIAIKFDNLFLHETKTWHVFDIYNVVIELRNVIIEEEFCLFLYKEFIKIKERE